MVATDGVGRDDGRPVLADPPSRPERPLAPVRASLAVGPLLAISAVVVATLVAFAGGYGYHRDELYFLAAGENLSFGYPDQGPLTPAIAALMNAIAPESLTVLRIPAALATGATVLLTGMTAREIGGNGAAQILGSAIAAVASVFLVTGHLLSTTTFDLLAWTLVCLLVARLLRGGDPRWWLVVGLVFGLALLNKPLIAFLAAGLLAGTLAVGPRQVLRSGWLVLGALIAVGLWAPWLVWQAGQGWPQLEVAGAISGGGSTSSESRWAFLPFQLLLVSPLLAPVWIAGLLALLRRPSLRAFRPFAVCWVLLAAAFILTAGKPYYLAGMFAVLIAAGAIELERWLGHGRARVRRRALGLAIGLSAVVSAVIALPVLPAGSTGPVLAANEDVGETIGWPEFVDTVAGAAQRLPPGAPDPVIVAFNYGQAGAIDRYGPALGLSRASSGHNGYWYWTRPPSGSGPVLAVGFASGQLDRRFSGCRPAGRVDTPEGVDNEEDGTLLALCAGPADAWDRLWPRLKRLG